MNKTSGHWGGKFDGPDTIKNDNKEKIETYPVTKNGRCGPEHKTSCPGSQCCSKFGWCGGSKGTNDEWCMNKTSGDWNGKFDGSGPVLPEKLKCDINACNSLTNKYKKNKKKYDTQNFMECEGCNRETYPIKLTENLVKPNISLSISDDLVKPNISLSA